MGKERRRHLRIPIAADLAEPVEIAVFSKEAASGKDRVKPQKIPAILANISAGGMALVAFAPKNTFSKATSIQLMLNLPSLGKSAITGRLVHLKSREDIQSLGVRFNDVTKQFRDRIRHIIDDYSDCETRVGLRIPEVCTGQVCHYFGLCKKVQKLELT